jgi:hypothetical protein
VLLKHIISNFPTYVTAACFFLGVALYVFYGANEINEKGLAVFKSIEFNFTRSSEEWELCEVHYDTLETMMPFIAEHISDLGAEADRVAVDGGAYFLGSKKIIVEGLTSVESQIGERARNGKLPETFEIPSFQNNSPHKDLLIAGLALKVLGNRLSKPRSDAMKKLELEESGCVSEELALKTMTCQLLLLQNMNTTICFTMDRTTKEFMLKIIQLTYDAIKGDAKEYCNNFFKEINPNATIAIEEYNKDREMRGIKSKVDCPKYITEL